MNFKSGIARSYNLIGLSFLKKAFVKSLEYFQKQFNIAKGLSDKLLIKNALKNIAVVYEMYLNDYTKAIEVQKKI